MDITELENVVWSVCLAQRHYKINRLIFERAIDRIAVAIATRISKTNEMVSGERSQM